MKGKGKSEEKKHIHTHKRAGKKGGLTKKEVQRTEGGGGGEGS